MIAVPPSLWPELVGPSASEVSAMLLDLALRVPMERMLRDRRGPRSRSRGEARGRRNDHLATKKLLDKAKGVRPAKENEWKTP